MEVAAASQAVVSRAEALVVAAHGLRVASPAVSISVDNQNRATTSTNVRIGAKTRIKTKITIVTTRMEIWADTIGGLQEPLMALLVARSWRRLSLGSDMG